MIFINGPILESSIFNFMTESRGCKDWYIVPLTKCLIDELFVQTYHLGIQKSKDLRIAIVKFEPDMVTGWTMLFFSFR